MTGPKDDGAPARRGLPGPVARRIADALAVAMMLVAIAWAVQLPRILNLGFYPQQYFAAILALVLPIAYLTLPARRGARRPAVPWLDVALAALSFGIVAWFAWSYPDLVLKIFMRPPEVWVPGVIASVLVLEALRRATGWALVIIIAVFLLYALFGDIVPGRLQGRPQHWQLLAGYMALDSNGILGSLARSRVRPSPTWSGQG